MPDQAAGLRTLFTRRRPSLVVIVGSDAGKGAVAAHFAREAAAAMRATVLVDGSAGMAALACGVASRYELAHVIAGDKSLADVLRAVTPCLLLLPAARALERHGSYSADENARLAQAFSGGITDAFAAAGTDEAQLDLIVVLAGDGRADRAVEAFGRDARVVVVASNDTGSLQNAYLEMKVLAQQHGIENFEVVVPGVDADRAFTKLSNAARRFLDIELVDGGSIPPARPGPEALMRPTAMPPPSMPLPNEVLHAANA